jgi:hypothetical protein
MTDNREQLLTLAKEIKSEREEIDLLREDLKTRKNLLKHKESEYFSYSVQEFSRQNERTSNHV